MLPRLLVPSNSLVVYAEDVPAHFLHRMLTSAASRKQAISFHLSVVPQDIPTDGTIIAAGDESLVRHSTLSSKPHRNVNPPSHPARSGEFGHVRESGVTPSQMQQLCQCLHLDPRGRPCSISNWQQMGWTAADRCTELLLEFWWLDECSSYKSTFFKILSILKNYALGFGVH